MKTKHIIMPILAACGILCSQFEVTAESVTPAPEKQRRPGEDLYQLGMDYMEGVGEIQDQAKACEYFLKAAELGHDCACYNLGMCHTLARGVP